MPHRCPWWLTYSFDNPLRRMVHDGRAILAPFVRPGMIVADLGCGFGHFTVALAEAVGPDGRVLAVDVQEEQLAHTRRRCERAGLSDRVELVRAGQAGPGLGRALDFALSFWMVHEVDPLEPFVAEVAAALQPGAEWLIAEPKLHVRARAFDEELSRIERHGFTRRPVPVRLSHGAVLTRRAA
jgi:ubiquinone/menaquinone biosynthesis C-methylase UbiE